MRWDKNYKNPELINDPTVIPAYGVTDEERARWNAKQDALEYDSKPTAFSDKHLISGAIYNALEQYKVSTVQACQAYYATVAGGLIETQQIVTDASASAALSKDSASDSASAAASSAIAASASALDASIYSSSASANAATASLAADNSENSSKDSEAWAVGTRGGVPVDSEDPAYHHNSKYYADLGREVIDDTSTSLEYTWSSEKISNNFDGKADLENGRVPAAQLPSFVDDVLEYTSLSSFPAEGESGKIYIAIDTGLQYRWSGTDYAVISESLALGETASTAYAGNKGKANADNIVTLQTVLNSVQEKIPSTASSSNKLATAGDIPTALSELAEDTTHRTVTDDEKSSWNTKAPGVHNHDDRYYTETEVDSFLQAKSNTGHNHDDRYYTETEIDTMFAGVTFTVVSGTTYINW